MSLTSVLILSSHVHLSLLSGLFPTSLPTKFLYTFLISVMRATVRQGSFDFTADHGNAQERYTRNVL